MTERVILCGSASERALPIDDAAPVRLNRFGPNSNVRLTIEDVSRPMVKALPSILEDLIDIATYVYVADQAVSRGGNTGADLGESWRRRLYFRIPVRDPDRWNSEAVLAPLVSTLSFLSEDEYHFEFEPLKQAEHPQQSIEFTDTPYDGIAEEVLLFSGGLDSLAGAIQESVIDKRKVILVNHRSTEKLSIRHQDLRLSLREHAGNFNPIHIPVRINKDESLTHDFTQRSRSFLYACLAASVAWMVGLTRFRFYENGVVSLNLPLSPQVVGARATRTTHPRVLRGYAELFSVLTEGQFAVENRFWWKTKTEVVQLIAETGCQNLLAMTNSCATTWCATNDNPHCGRCSQCIDRRFAMLAAKQSGHDPASDYAVDLLTGERSDGITRSMLAAYVETANQLEKMKPIDFFGRFGEASRALRCINGEADVVAREVYELHRRHAKQVLSVVDQGLRDFAQELRQRTLPASCLLRLVAGSLETEPITKLSVDPLGQNVFRRKGQAWIVRFNGHDDFILLPSRGAGYLHKLLSQPNTPISALDLACRVAREGLALSLNDRPKVTDKSALAMYRGRLIEIDAELEEARSNNDFGNLEKLERDRELLRKEVKAAISVAGGLRTFDDELQRARRAVGIAIRRAIKDISQFDKSLAEHLHFRLRCGQQPRYSSEPGVVWET